LNFIEAEGQISRDHGIKEIHTFVVVEAGIQKLIASLQCALITLAGVLAGRLPGQVDSPWVVSRH